MHVDEHDTEVPEQVANEARVLDLLDRSRDPEDRLVVLAEALGDQPDVGEVAVTDRLEAGAMPRGDKVGVIGELHERVAPVEEDGFEQGARVAAWAGSSSGRRWFWPRSPSYCGTCSTLGTSCCSCPRRSRSFRSR